MGATAAAGAGRATTSTRNASTDFVDSNVFVYAADDGEPVKRDRARRLLAERHADVVISAQVLGEFYSASTRKLGLPADQVAVAVDQLSALRVVPVDAGLVQRGVEVSRAAQISYWDGLIVAAAASAGCRRLLTEDLSEGATLGGVLVENPFSDP